MSRGPHKKVEAVKVESQPETRTAEEAGVPVVGQAPEVKEQQNDQTSVEAGKENATIEQIEGRVDAQRVLDASVEGHQEPLADPDNPQGEPTHQLVPPVVDPVADQAMADALAVQAAQVQNVKNAFVAETRAETLDGHKPQRIENVRVLVESNDHLDRSGDNVKESPDTRIVMSDGVDEARMIDVQPAGEIAEEFDLGSGIRQTNLK